MLVSTRKEKKTGTCSLGFCWYLSGPMSSQPGSGCSPVPGPGDAFPVPTPRSVIPRPQLSRGPRGTRPPSCSPRPPTPPPRGASPGTRSGTAAQVRGGDG